MWLFTKLCVCNNVKRSLLVSLLSRKTCFWCFFCLLSFLFYIFRGRSALKANQGRSKQKISLVSRTFKILIWLCLRPNNRFSKMLRSWSKLLFPRCKIKFPLMKTKNFIKKLWKYFFMEKNRHEKRERRNCFDNSTKTDSAQRKFSSRLLLVSFMCAQCFEATIYQCFTLECGCVCARGNNEEKRLIWVYIARLAKALDSIY